MDVSVVQSAPPTIIERKTYILALCAETLMISDFIAGNTEHSLAEVKLPVVAGWPGNISEAMMRVEETRERLADDGARPQLDDLAFVQTMRDALGVLARPASGLTIAYTALVTAPQRRAEPSDSRARLAKYAYPGLECGARSHRLMKQVFLYLAIAVTAYAVWVSAKAALGKSLVQTIDVLHSQQAQIYTARVALETLMDKTAMVPPDKRSPYGVCEQAHIDRATAVKLDQSNDTLPFHDAQARDLCEKEDVLGKNFVLLHRELLSYLDNWTAKVRGPFAWPGRLLWTVQEATAWVTGKPHWPEPPLGLDPKESADIELVFAPVLLVWGNYILPVVFGLLGACLYVILDQFNKLRRSELHPKDLVLGPIRLVLGLVTGACIGLFFSSYSPAPASTVAPGTASLVASLTLSASGVAFLAGFGVEGVFTMLESLVGRVFALDGKTAR